jgi:hypothetical protein
VHFNINIAGLPAILDLCRINYGTNTLEGLRLEKVIKGNEDSSHEVFCWQQEKLYIHAYKSITKK